MVWAVHEEGELLWKRVGSRTPMRASLWICGNIRFIPTQQVIKEPCGHDTYHVLFLVLWAVGDSFALLLWQVTVIDRPKKSGLLEASRQVTVIGGFQR